MYPIRRVQLACLVSFVFGLLARDNFSQGYLAFLCFLLASVLVGAYLAKEKRVNRLALYGLIFLVGCTYMHVSQLASHHYDAFLNQEVTVRGKVISSLKEKPTLFLRVETLEGREVKPFTVQVKKAYQDERHYLLGERLSFEGKLTAPQVARNLGGFDEAKYLKSKGVFYKLKAKKEGVNLEEASTIFGLVNQTRAHLTSLFEKELSPKNARFLEGVLFGERGLLEEDFYALSQKMGLAHLFAVSGLHVGFLALFILLVFRFLPFKHFLLLGALAILLIYYTLLAGGVPSAIRATGLILLALLLKKCLHYQDLPTLLGWIFFVLVLINPFALYDIGVILSFSLALGLGLFNSTLRGYLPQKPKALWNAFGISLTAEMISLPLIAYFFYLVTPFSVFYNLIFVPLFSILVPLALLSCLLHMVSGVLGACGFWLVDKLISLIFFLMAHLEDFFGTGHFYVGTPSLLWLLGYGLFLFVLYYVLRSKKIRLVMGMGLVFLCLAFSLPTTPPKALSLSVLDVGQGSGATYQLSNGKWLVFDTGTSKDTLASDLRYRGVDEIEAIILSHGDQDHVGGLYHLLRDFKVNHLVLSQYAFEHSEHLKDLPYYLSDKATKVHFIEGQSHLALTDSESLDLALIDQIEAPNSHEVVALLCDEGINYLFPGDTEGRALKEIPFSSKVDVLLAPHHGSKNSWDEAFYNKYHPKLVVASAGVDNRFHHPHQEVVEGLAKLGYPFLQTPKGGAVYFYQEAKSLAYQRALPEVADD